MTERTLARLLQLSSVTLPVGAFSYSQGLEWAVHASIVTDEASAASWLIGVLEHGIGRWDAPWIGALMRAWRQREFESVKELNERYVASRETRELMQESVQMGRSMLAAIRQSQELPTEMIETLSDIHDRQAISFPVAWSASAVHWGIPSEDAITGYLWSWLENSVMAALKLVPLGQFAGQRLLARLGADLRGIAVHALTRPPDDCTNLLPGLTLASMQHETQYTRICRS